ncbi:MAG TPA: transketolase C-terminal domain-containing protein [Candidatus Paceibacterota bacterium]|nr:transketolase C-terminal domain-containing protein [Candidatus Paceibacterota bacterium]
MSMLRKDAQLAENLFDSKLPEKPTRDGFGTGTVEAAKANENVVVVCADLKESTRAEWFEKEFPDRYIEVGVAEQHMATVAAGLAAVGKIPFIASYAAFSPGRNYEQIRTTAALNELPVKVCGMHAGVSVGPDGATHQMLEDVGMMRMLPHMTVINPADAEEARKAVVAAAEHPGPVYLRFGRAGVPVFTTPQTPFVLGKALTLWESAQPKVALLGTGPLSYTALLAARALEADGIGSIVIHVPTIKPLDAETIIAAAKRAGRVLTVEEHQVAGGFGGAVAELLSERLPVPVRRLGLQDSFGQSGEPQELLAHYGLDVGGITKVAIAFARS